MSSAAEFSLPDWPRVWGEPLGEAVLRAVPEDFYVDETLDYPFSGDGEFVYVRLEKRGETTDFAARALARFAGVKSRDISFSGLKDKHAVTRQWFSVHIPGKPEAAPDWSQFDEPGMRILDTARHRKKLRRGNHASNRFRLRLSAIALANGVSQAAVDARLEQIAKHGVPNYFGPQRFGNRGGNIPAARAWLIGGDKRAKPFQKRMYLSALRSFLFNEVLAERVRLGNWSSSLEGDVYLLDGRERAFREAPEKVQERLLAGELHVSGPLLGRYRSDDPGKPEAESELIEQGVLAQWPEDVRALEPRLDAQRRALRMMAEDLHWQWQEDGSLVLEFALQKGCFATALVRELLVYREPDKRRQDDGGAA